jgi:DNA replication protein DnaC
MNNSIYNQLTANLELLKLSQMKLHLDEIRDFVTNNSLSFTEGLLKLSNYEVDFKEQSASRSMIKAAAFSFVKELKDFDFEFQQSVNEQEMRELTNLGFLEKNENIVFLGPSGVGKTHLATSIGIAAAKKHVSTYFIKCNDLLQQLKRAQLENRLDARLKHFSKYRLLIIDEIGYLPINKEDSNFFFSLQI